MGKSVMIYMLAFTPLSVTAQDAMHNYVQKSVMLDRKGSARITDIQYYDGLGRVVQTATNSQGNNGTFVYTSLCYDMGDRVVKETLPAAGGKTPDWLDSVALRRCLSAQYPNESYPYSQNVYDGLGRTVLNWGAGSQWRSSGRSVQNSYSTNGASEVIRYSVSPEGKLKHSGFYGAGVLYKTVTTDEDRRVLTVYTDQQGRKVMERQHTSCTYYVYDSYGMLSFVIPPVLADMLTSPGAVWDVSASLLRQYAYCYRYDSRNRCTWKQLPGCNAVTMQYDRADRLLFMSDGLQASAGRKTFHLYDKFGREVVTGTCSSGDAVSTASQAKAEYTGTGPLGGYATSLPLTDVTLLTVNYYDDYQFRNRLSQSEQSLLSFETDGGGTWTVSAVGYLTGSLTYQLKETSKYSATIHCYDIMGRVVSTVSTNHLGGRDAVYTTYSFTGNPVRVRHVHTAAGKPVQTELYTYSYDSSDRLRTVTHQLNNNSVVTLTGNQYDTLGRLTVDTRNGNGNLRTSYTYNVRSWLKSITSGTKFSETLFYNESHDGNTPRWGGDISAMDWKADSKTRGYVFSYDGLSRLTQASYSENGTGNGHYNTEYTYDKMGNILSLTRYGLRDNNQYGLIDNLTFTYNGNQVTRVEDAVSGPFYSGAFHFVNGSGATTEYTYDQNGNMTKDLNKNISSIQYNLLNLPSKITYQDGRMINYIYSATGTKLSVTYTNGGTTTNNQYCGNMLYENGTLKQILIDGGYITFNGSTPQYHFYLKDHLGNNRVVVNASGTVEQVNHYYPYGGLMGESTNGDIQRYKYNGKELDRMNGLDWYDYGARYMDGIRFTTMDPMAEKYYGISPYVYCKDNPVNRIDPDGKTDYIVNRDGYMYESTSFIEKVKSFFGIGSNQDRVYMEGSKKLIVSLPEGAINLLENDKGITKVEINVNKFAEKFTDAVMKETDVEWARVEHGNKKSISNTIQNNHDDRNVDSVVPTMELYRAKGETIYLFDHSHPIPKRIKGTNAEGLIKINVSPEDKSTVSKYNPVTSRVMNKQTNKIEYYNSKGVYRYEKW